MNGTGCGRVRLLGAISGVGIAAANKPGIPSAYQFLPNLPAGLSLAMFETFGEFGIEGSLNAGGSDDGQERMERFSLSLGTNLATPIGLYPSFALSAESLRRSRVDDLIENRIDWGLDVKITRVVRGRES